jgi:ankyrin repeat protein
MQGHIEVVWVLLRHGFSVSDIDDCGNTALHLASAGGFTEIVKSLLCSGVVLGVANWYGNTALDLATNADTRSLLHRLTDQLRCPATNVGAWAT